MAPSSSESAPMDPRVREALVAYLEAMALSEPIQVELWQSARVTLTQLSVLRQLRQGPRPAGKLASSVGLSPTSATRLLDRLAERGLISRRRDPEDRRCVQIHLEPEGQRVLGELKVVRGSDLHRAVEAMTAPELRQLTGALRRLVEHAQEGSRPPPAPAAPVHGGGRP
jgi:DNA-binding MarR family transcriptional regulator